MPLRKRPSASAMEHEQSEVWQGQPLQFPFHLLLLFQVDPVPCSVLTAKSTFLCRIVSQFSLQIHQNDRGGVKCYSPGQDREQMALTHSCLVYTSHGHCTCLCSHPRCRRYRLPTFAACQKEQAGASGNELLETLGEKEKHNSVYSS